MGGWDVCDCKQHKGDLGGGGISLYLDCDGGYTNLYMGKNDREIYKHIMIVSISWF